MAHGRTISPDIWTWEAVIDRKPMTRLLFIGLWNFADDFGAQPLRPRIIRMQVFPGDDVDSDKVRDKRARRRFPSPCEGQGPRTAPREKVPSVSADQRPLETIANHSIGKVSPSPTFAFRAPSPSEPSAAPDMRGKKEEHPPPDAMRAAV